MRLAARTTRALAAAAVLGAALAHARARSASGEETTSGARTLALRAGTIHLVEEGRVLRGGATILVRDGKVLAVGSDVDPVPGAEVVDYGPDAVIVPGLVAASSPYATGSPPERTAAPWLRAVDGFDATEVYAGGLSGGVTTAYVTPAEGRLIAGQGALVKLAGDDPARRVVNERAALHGAIDASARGVPGFWEPPIPASDDIGIGYAKPQLPGSTMGAIAALEELVDGIHSREKRAAIEREYGAQALRELAPLVEAEVPWRIAARTAPEIRALLEFARSRKLPLIVDRADAARAVAAEIAAAGAAVVFQVPFDTNGPAVDRGKGKDDPWPSFDAPRALIDAGVRVAIAGSSPRDLLFFARLASRGGLSPDAALRAITLTPAELFGGADRVGSIRPGKDADFCVLNGPPTAEGTTVLATWIDGRTAWSPAEPARGSTVVEVDELFVGDGRVLRPGALVLQGGKIVEVGERVAHPRGSTVVRGRVCMPGMIDALGHLGLEGSRKVPPTDFRLGRVVGRPDRVDRRVALGGITTVVLVPRGAANTGAPVMAYRPAAADLGRRIVGDPVAVRLKWTDENRLQSGQAVRDLLAKAAEYRAKWLEYQKALEAWKVSTAEAKPKPSGEAPKADGSAPEKGEKDAAAEKDGEKADERAAEEGKKDEAPEKEEESKKDAKKKKDKKEGEELAADPITGIWEAEIAAAEERPASRLRLQLLFAAKQGSGEVTGNLRASALSDTLVDVRGRWDREAKKLGLEGIGSSGWLSLEAALGEKGLEGRATSAGKSIDFVASHTSTEYVVARRPERKKVDPPAPDEPKGKPKEPRLDPKLEPLRRAMDGEASVVVQVDRGDEILECVAAFEARGIRPVLLGANEAHLVAAQLAGRVAGVLLAPAILRLEPERGTDYITPYATLQGAGVPVAFHSEAEEGAVDLPLQAAFAVANGLSPTGAVRALTSDAARMMSISDRVGRLERGLDADVLLLDGPPLAPETSILRTWVAGEEVKP
jgi:imidazolonepropionase-like amidohydrolase